MHWLSKCPNFKISGKMHFRLCNFSGKRSGFIIYFIINLGGYTITKLSDPRRQFFLSIGALLLFNILARMGEVWFDKNPSYWPGPLTYFGVVVLPLICIYVFDDMRRYLTVNYALNTSKSTIDNLKKVEVGLMIAVALIMVVGFIKAMIESKEKTGKNFNFILFWLTNKQNKIYIQLEF